VKAELTLAMAFAAGLFGGLHCLGMCGGLAGGFFIQRQAQPRLSSQLLYHASRLVLYALLGMAGAWAGQTLAQSGLTGKGQGVIMMVAGVLILVLGLRMLLALSKGSCKAPTQGPEVRLDAKPRTQRSWSCLLFGAFNGLMPCGLIFSMGVKATATGDPGRAGLLMLAFGLGTLPMMVAVTLFGAFIGARVRNQAAQIAGGLVIALGLWTLYEGYVFFDIMRGLANG
jgi:uncharacterized protein